MATLTLNIPTGVTNRVLDAISTKYGYTGFLANGVTPQTKPEFVKAWIIKTVMAAVKEQEANTAAATAASNANTDADTNIVIT